MAVHKDKTNFMREFADESEQQQAYQVLLDYLVNMGHYADEAEADNDACERVRFCEEIDLYADNEYLKNASIHQKKIQALIHANGLQDVIAENDGNLPEINNTVSTQLSPVQESNVISLVPGASPESVVVLEASENGSLASAEKAVTESVSTVEDLPAAKRNPFLQAVLYLAKSVIIIGILLISLTLLLSSEQQLQIIKYGFLLFAVLMFLFVGFSEVSSKTLKHLRYAVGHILFITTTSLSGLLFMQQPWLESTFTFRGGFLGLVVNSIIHTVLTIGPYWLGTFFAVMAFFLFIATQAAAVPLREK